ncbi:hypothetical protein F4V57_09060 [Acinetobacter qingfengensis]|uniref:Uncharacterized protein n=1 Tax=Acinetobacter qingfengensis TaxID=1262585 RepID=A0A1E7RFZ7_9GAMM|nr:hypothetical protein [Acinetobacter qingfengensis]KAA8732705.1 hypothetical protein F4V57_09060 [Acinetobacter qingfengensis]OEY98182.1 hypothetical protein BJI46_01285 [Acinetobacter qingfengensis]
MIEKFRKYHYALIAFIGVLTITGLNAAPLKILDFKSNQLSPLVQQQVCKNLASLCHEKSTLLSIAVDHGELWILSQNKIVQFKQQHHQLKLQQQWEISIPENDEFASVSHYIYPKLFPVAQQRYAIARIDEYSETYSEGGAHIERASFYGLRTDGQLKSLINNYPFSFNRIIRACFSERDYATSDGNCHDEDQLTLDIRPINPMQWQFRYHYNLKLSPASDSQQKSHQGNRVINIDLTHIPTQPDIPEAWNFHGQD